VRFSIDHSLERRELVVETGSRSGSSGGSSGEIRNAGESEGYETRALAIPVSALTLSATERNWRSDEYVRKKEAVLPAVGPDARDVVIVGDGEVDAFTAGAGELGAWLGEGGVHTDKSGE
jgi:hypothetical protein